MENLSHREYWIRLFVIFDAETRTSTSLLLHLLPPERDFIEQKLRDKTLYPLTLHPLFVPTLVIELLFQETTEYLDFAFGASIGMYIAAGLHDSAGYRYYKRTDLDMEKAAEKSLGHGQRILVLCEKLESNVKIANKLLSWFGELPTDKMSAEQKEHFESAGAIIRNRLESLIDGFGFQLIRLKRVQGHAQLNRVGVRTVNMIFQDYKTQGD
jgi:hypothetical protein